MATMIFNHTTTAPARAAAPATVPAKKSFFMRVIEAIQASNQRKADIEIRRAMASMDTSKAKPDYAMLPFQGE
ncbi:MAG: hypothetical protein ACRCWF_14180 [Beijerinckiaceae bacterium]